MMLGYTVDVVPQRDGRPRPPAARVGRLGRVPQPWIQGLPQHSSSGAAGDPAYHSAGHRRRNDRQQGTGAEAIGITIMVCGRCLLFLWALFVTLLTPAIYVRIAATDRFSSAFEFGRMWAFTRDNIGSVIIALLLLVVVGIIASVVALLGFVALIMWCLDHAPARDALAVPGSGAPVRPDRQV